MRITFPANGKTRTGYLASPPVPGPAIIVLPEWWGLVPHIEDLARRFAACGMNALAPDLYEGHTAKSPDDAAKLMMALHIAATAKTLGGAIRHLLAHPATRTTTVGVVGFCMGGQLALFAATAFPDEVGAVVDFYGIHPAVTIDLAHLRAPLLGFFAENDRSVPPAHAHKLDAELGALGKPRDIQVLPGVGHAFFNDTRPDVYHAETARACWERTLAHFRAHLR